MGLENSDYLKSSEDDSDVPMDSIFNSIQDSKDKPMRDTAWKEVCETMGQTDVIVKQRWINLKSYYTKEKRLQLAESKSGSGSSLRKKFTYFKQMCFMEPFLKQRKCVTNVEKNQNQKSMNNSQDGFVNNSKRMSQAQAQSSLTPPNPKRNKKDVADKVEESITGLTDIMGTYFSTNKQSEKENFKSQDEDEIFANFLVSKMKNLPQEEKLLLQAQFTQTVYQKLLNLNVC